MKIKRICYKNSIIVNTVPIRGELPGAEIDYCSDMYNETMSKYRKEEKYEFSGKAVRLYD